MSRTAAQLIQAEIARDSEKPCGKFGFNSIAMSGLINLDENDLRQILSFSGVREGPVNHVENRLPVLLNQYLKSALIALRHALHQGCIRIGLDGHRFQSSRPR